MNKLNVGDLVTLDHIAMPVGTRLTIRRAWNDQDDLELRADWQWVVIGVTRNSGGGAAIAWDSSRWVTPDEVRAR